MKKLSKYIGIRIRSLRQERNWLQADLANKSGLPVRTIGRIERGEVDVRISTLFKIAKALGVTLKDVIGYDYA